MFVCMSTSISLELPVHAQSASFYFAADRAAKYFDDRVCLYVFASLHLCLQCFDAVGWAAGRASGL